ncbi:hypothetical protein T492DRAFT_30575 [Pavlovales sp. CCMP2436]|nr:hypothetical protein T492DRAFT_30575 [Pavlovales sp. CCMP2436]
MSDERSNFRSSNSSGYGNSGYEGQGQGRGGYDSPGNSSGPYVRPLQQQYSGGGRSGGRSGGEGHGRGEGRGRGVGRGRAEPLLPPEQKQLGTVANIKENFGFIQGGDFGRVFFHFSEVLGPEPLQQGDAVLFGLRDDPRTGKTAAVQIVVVAAEELRSVDVEPGRVVGNIMVAPKRGRRDADAQTGRVQVQLGGEGTEVLSFAANDMVPDSPGLYAGDIVELSVGFERISRRRRACQMAFLESTLPRLQGAAATIKDSFGFINTPDSSEQFFFHFSELPDELRGEGELRVGQEFEFSVMDSEQSRPQPTGGRGGGGGSNLPSAKCAVRLKPLQRGTLDWMESMPGVYVGEIAQVTQDKRRGASGRLACTARVLDESLPPSTEGTSVPAALAASVTDASALQTAPSELHGTMLSFSCSSVEAAVDAVPSNEVSRPAGMSADVRLSAAFSKSTESAETLKAQSLLLPGTYVVFRLQRERPSGQLRAIEVVALSEAEGVREDGVVESIKDGLGYIELVDREGRAFFHVSALPEGVPLSTARFTEVRQ